VFTVTLNQSNLSLMNKRINKTPDVADFNSSVALDFSVIKHRFTQGKRHEQD